MKKILPFFFLWCSLVHILIVYCVITITVNSHSLSILETYMNVSLNFRFASFTCLSKQYDISLKSLDSEWFLVRPWTYVTPCNAKMASHLEVKAIWPRTFKYAIFCLFSFMPKLWSSFIAYRKWFTWCVERLVNGKKYGLKIA